MPDMSERAYGNPLSISCLEIPGLRLAGRQSAGRTESHTTDGAALLLLLPDMRKRSTDSIKTVRLIKHL